MILQNLHIVILVTSQLPISARRADMGPLGLICHAIWILAYIILFIIYYQAEIAIINEDIFLLYLTIDLFVVTYFFIVTSLICISYTHADIDVHFLHGVLIWVQSNLF